MVYDPSRLPSAVQRTWVEWLAEKGSPDSGTVREYRSIWNAAQEPLGRVLRESDGRLSPLEVRQFADLLLSQGKKPSTVALYLSVMSSFWMYLQQQGYVQHNPWRAVKRPRGPETFAQRVLSEEEVLRLIEAADPGRDRLLLRFLYLSGARVSEAARLRWGDWSERAGRIVVQLFGKGQKTRWVAMPSWYYQQLVKELAGGAPGALDVPVWTSAKGAKGLTDRQIRNIVYRAAARAGILQARWDPNARRVVYLRRPSPHWLRHSHASHALDRGAPIHVVQATLGHASLATTGRYMHARPGESSADYIGLGALMGEAAQERASLEP